MKQKSGSLTYPKNPLNYMRGLQDLDSAVTPVAHYEPDVPSSTLPTGSQVTNATSSEAIDATSSVVSSEARRRPIRKEPVNTPDPKETSGSPIESALIEMLGKPYLSEDGKGPFTISTVKVQTEISERLGYAATLTKRAKQEIIGEALKDYFKKILRSQ